MERAAEGRRIDSEGTVPSPTGHGPGGPRVVGQYAIYEPIATGGMASVHYGRLRGPVGFSRTVAIKCLRPELAANPEFSMMFLDEARIAARIRHPNVVATIDVVAAESEVFLVMEYVHGEPLSTLMKRGGIPLPIALRITSDALQGLHAAHEAKSERGLPLNIVHRDVSPQNILVGVDGIARLVDFGVANAAGQSGVSRKGTLKGKLGYMAPEQLARTGHEPPVSRQTDIHAVAVVLWEMLMGRRLFLDDSEASTVGKVLAHDVPLISLESPEIPAAVDAVISGGLALNVEDRFRTAEEMCLALESCGKMASSIAVSEWMRSRVASSLALRAQTVKAIEEDTGGTMTMVTGVRVPEPTEPVTEVRPPDPEQEPEAEPAGSSRRTDPAPAPGDGAAAPDVEIPKLAPPPTMPEARAASPAVPTSVVPPRSRRRALVSLALGAALLSSLGVVLAVDYFYRPSFLPSSASPTSPSPEGRAKAPAAPEAPAVAPQPPETASAVPPDVKLTPVPRHPAPVKVHRANPKRAHSAFETQE